MGICYKFELSDDGTIVDKKEIGANNSYRDVIDVEDYEDLESEDINMDELFNENVEIETETKKGRRKKEKKPLTKKGIAIRAVSVFGAVVIFVNGVAACVFRNNIKVASSNASEIEEFIKYDNNGVVEEAKYFLVKVENCLEMVELSNKLNKQYSSNSSFNREAPVYAEDGSLMCFDEDIYAELVDAYNIVKNEQSTRDEILKASVYIVKMGPTMEAWLASTAADFSKYAASICTIKSLSCLDLESSEQIYLNTSNDSLSFERVEENGSISYSLPATGFAFNIVDNTLIEMLNANEVDINEKTIKKYAMVLRRLICSDDFEYKKNASIGLPAIINGMEEVKTEDSSLSYVRKRVL